MTPRTAGADTICEFLRPWVSAQSWRWPNGRSTGRQRQARQTSRISSNLLLRSSHPYRAAWACLLRWPPPTRAIWQGQGGAHHLFVIVIVPANRVRRNLAARTQAKAIGEGRVIHGSLCARPLRGQTLAAIPHGI